MAILDGLNLPLVRHSLSCRSGMEGVDLTLVPAACIGQFSPQPLCIATSTIQLRLEGSIALLKHGDLRFRRLAKRLKQHRRRLRSCSRPPLLI